VVTAVVTLGLAIGAGSAAFAVVDAVRFRALPFPAADRLVVLGEVGSETGSSDCGGACSVSYETYADVLSRYGFTTLDAVEAYASGGKALDLGDDQVMVTGGVVSPNLFDVLGVAAMRGRTFAPEDNVLGAPSVTILSHALWSQQFGEDAGIVGRMVQLSDTRYTVIGVMPRGFDFESGMQFWLPVEPTLDPSTLPSIRSVTVFGRLAPGRTSEQLRAELANVEPVRLTADVPATRIVASPIRTRYISSTRSHDLIFAAVVLCVLIIACANLGNLILVRTLHQQRELATRAALGAGPRRLARNLFAQHLVLALAGSTLGLLTAWRLVDALASLDVLSSLRPTGMKYRIDARVFAFACGLAVLAVAALSIVPVRLIARVDPQQALREGGPTSSAGRGMGRTQRTFVVVQIAAAVILLTGAGLLARTALRLSGTDPGYDASRVLVATPSLPHPWREPGTYVPLFDRILTELNGITDVNAAAVRASVPFLSPNGELRVEGRADAIAASLAPRTAFAITPEYFDAIGVRLERGRFFNATDRLESNAVAIINSWAARHWWPERDAIGRTFRITSSTGVQQPVMVVGVVADNRAAGPGGILAEEGPEVYRPFDQQRSAFPSFVIRASDHPATLVRPIRQLLLRAVPNRPVFTALAEETLNGQMRGVRTNALQILGFALVGLMLALTGVYGVLSYTVGRRAREIAIRGALGATRAATARMVLADTARLAVIGIAIGLPVASLATRLIGSMLYGTNPRDPAVYVFVAVSVIVVALAASWLPARRATRIEPASALRAA
jgi:putative ABC transport system permease protein